LDPGELVFFDDGSMALENSSAFLFDDLRVGRAMFRAFKAGNAIHFEPKAFRLLLFLIENRGRLIEKMKFSRSCGMALT